MIKRGPAASIMLLRPGRGRARARSCASANYVKPGSVQSAPGLGGEGDPRDSSIVSADIPS